MFAKHDLGKALPTIIPSQFVVGQDNQGHWLALETHGRSAGIFVSKGAALHHAVVETDHRPGAVVLSDVPVSLGFALTSH